MKARAAALQLQLRLPGSTPAQDTSKEYFDLRLSSMSMWRELTGDFPNFDARFTGSIAWELQGSELEQYISHMTNWGYQLRLIERDEIERREPALHHYPEAAVLTEVDGAVEPVKATLTLLDAVKALGGKIINGSVSHISTNAGAISAINVGGETMPVDGVVFATGRQTELFNQLGYVPPIDVPAGLLIYTKPIAKLLNGLILAQDVHFRQTADGAIVAGSDYGGAIVGDDVEQSAQTVFSALKDLLPDAGLQFDRYIAGYRPTPADGFPIIGFVPQIENAYVTIMHSGVTLAPAVGSMAATEILHGERDPLLQPYSPVRFL